MVFDAYYISMISEGYKNGKGGLAAMLNGFWTGFISNNHARGTGEYSSLIYVIKKKWSFREKLVAEYIKNENKAKGEHEEILNLPPTLPSGTYFIQIASTKGSISIKAIK